MPAEPLSAEAADVIAWREFSDRFMDPAYRDDPERLHIRDAFAAGWDAAERAPAPDEWDLAVEPLTKALAAALREEVPDLDIEDEDVVMAQAEAILDRLGAAPLTRVLSAHTPSAGEGLDVERLAEAMDILDVIDGIVDDTHPEGDGCPLCVALDDLRAALSQQPTPATGTEGLDVERLAEAITMHSVAQRAGGPDAYLGHKCMGDCAEAIGREYAALGTPR